VLEEEILQVKSLFASQEAFYYIFKGQNTRTENEIFNDLISNLQDPAKELVEFCKTLAFARVFLGLTVE
jgi:hypothetical protein